MAVDVFTAATGTTQYVVLIDPITGGWWNTSGTPAYETFAGGNYASYKIAATEYGTTGLFKYTVPATLPAGLHNVQSKTQAGGSPAQGDANGAGGLLDWHGAAVASVGKSVPAVAAGTSGGLMILGINTGRFVLTGPVDQDAVFIQGQGTGRCVAMTADLDAISVSGDAGVGLYLTGHVGLSLNSFSDGPGLSISGNGSNPAVDIVGGAGGAAGHGVRIGRGHATADDLFLLNSDAPTLGAAWGASVVGNGRTRDMYLQGMTNKVSFAADGLSWTLYSTDDTTPLFTGSSVRLGAAVGGLREVDPA